VAFASSAHALERAAAGLPGAASKARLQQLARAAAQARRAADRASEWGAPGNGEGSEEEEDLPRAESQLTSGAGELARAVAAIQTYARAHSASTLGSYRSKLESAREQWDDGITEIWHLAQESGPPTL